MLNEIKLIMIRTSIDVFKIDLKDLKFLTLRLVFMATHDFIYFDLF